MTLKGSLIPSLAEQMRMRMTTYNTLEYVTPSMSWKKVFFFNSNFDPAVVVKHNSVGAKYGDTIL